MRDSRPLPVEDRDRVRFAKLTALGGRLRRRLGNEREPPLQETHA